MPDPENDRPSSPPKPTGPRLVRPDEAPPARRRRSDRLPLVVLLPFALVAAFFAIHQAQRAAGLETRVQALSAELASARGELVARRAHLDAIRSSVAEVRDRVGALESLALSEPGATAPAPPAPAAESLPAH